MIKRSTIETPYAAEEMFALVADIERYPAFLPWCVALRIVSRRREANVELLSADMVVSYRMFRERFRSLVRLDAEQCRINVEYIDGPFRSLTNEWRFARTPNGGSIVDFAIAFEFRSLLLQATAHSVFERAFAKMSEAFVARAAEVYGTAGRGEE